MNSLFYRLLILTCFFWLVPNISLQASEISDAEVKGSWIYVYDLNGNRISSMSASNKQVAGVGLDFFVVINGSWIETYDANCKKIASFSASGRTVSRVAGNSFSVKSGSWVTIYDRNCRQLGSRSSH